MQLTDAVQYAMRNLSNRKLRSWLTVIGIVIGIITIVTVMSVGEGLRADITSQLDMFGSDSMFVIPINIEKSGLSMGSMGSRPTSGKLFEKDVDRILKIPGIKSVSKLIYGKASLEFKDKKINALVYAATEEMFWQWSNMYELEEGRFYKDSEINVAVLGNDAANELFGKKKIAVGNDLVINNEKYRVVGILKKIGTSLSQSDDQAIYVPFEDGKELFGKTLSKNEVSFISIQVGEGQDAEGIKEKIEFELASLHRVSLDEKDFTVMTAEFVNRTIGGILGIVNTFLLMITLVSGVVGGIGIANTMFMSVVERTKEIGILKAVGAGRREIMAIFLVESAIIGLVGGLIGIVAALFLVFALSGLGVPAVTKIDLVAYALLFAVGVGLVSGVLPARKAAEMDAVEALNFE